MNWPKVVLPEGFAIEKKTSLPGFANFCCFSPTIVAVVYYIIRPFGT